MKRHSKVRTSRNIFISSSKEVIWLILSVSKRPLPALSFHICTMTFICLYIFPVSPMYPKLARSLPTFLVLHLYFLKPVSKLGMACQKDSERQVPSECRGLGAHPKGRPCLWSLLVGWPLFRKASVPHDWNKTSSRNLWISPFASCLKHF